MPIKSDKPARKRTIRPTLAASPSKGAPSGRGSSHARPSDRADAPEIALSRTPVGRETLAAIVAEVGSEPPISTRPKLDTISYEERPRMPPAPRLPLTSAPEAIFIDEAPLGRETLAAIEADRAADTRPAAHPRPLSRVPAAPVPALLDAPVVEIATFIVRDGGALLFATEAFRREFVVRRLAHRLPIASVEDIERIEVTRGPADRHTTIRVHCLLAIPPPSIAR